VAVAHRRPARGVDAAKSLSQIWEKQLGIIRPVRASDNRHASYCGRNTRVASAQALSGLGASDSAAVPAGHSDHRQASERRRIARTSATVDAVTASDAATSGATSARRAQRGWWRHSPFEVRYRLDAAHPILHAGTGSWSSASTRPRTNS
jgi:hypothetical protein